MPNSAQPMGSTLVQRGRTLVDNLQSNAESILENDDLLKGCLRRSEFDGMILKCRDTPWGSPAGEAWTIHDQRELRSWIEKTHQWSPHDSLLTNAIEVVAHRNRFHPVKQYLESLSWDGTPRIDTWLAHYLGADSTDYTQVVGRKFLISAVARVMIPGCKVDSVLTLEGRQGIGKSSTFRALMPKAEWFRDTPLDLYNKDAYLGLQGAWLLEFAELESLGKVGVGRIKVFISSATDSYRPPYQKSVIHIPRQCVFVASTNENDYLKDITGGRRFWPVHCKCDHIDLDGIEANRDQLWAEAVTAFWGKETWYLGQAEERLARIEQEARREPDYLEDQVRLYVANRDFVTTENVLRAMGCSRDAINTRGTLAKRVGKILTEVLGWSKVRAYRDGIRLHGYMPSPFETSDLGWNDQEGAPDSEVDWGATEPSGRSAQLPKSNPVLLGGDFED